MADASSILEIILQAKDQATETIKKVGDQVEQTSKKTIDMGAAFRTSGTIITGVGVAGVGVMTMLADAAIEEQTAMASVDTTLKNVSESSKGTIGSYETLKRTTEDVSDAYLKLGFENNQTAKAFAQDLRVTKDVGDAKKLLAASTDLARLKHIDLGTATDALTRAYMGNQKVLKSLGIETDKGATGMSVIAKVQQAAAGQAEAYSKTYQGSMDKMGVTTDSLKEKLGARLLPTITDFMDKISGVIDKLNNLNPKTYDTIVKVLGLVTAFTLIAGPILLFLGFLPAIATGLGIVGAMFTFLLGPIGLVVLAVAGVIAIGVLLITHWKQVQEIGKTVFTAVGNFFTNLGKTVTGVVNQIVQDVKNMVNSIIDHINGLIHGINNVGGKIGLGGIKIPDIPKFEQGGYVPNTGLAMLHSGEFVLSKSMLSGQQNIPQQIKNTTNNNTPINIYATINQDMDMNLLGYKIAFALRNSR